MPRTADADIFEGLMTAKWLPPA